MIVFDPELKIFRSSKINIRSVLAGFATKIQGDAKRIETVINFFKTNNIGFENISIMQQIHSVNIQVISQKKEQEITIVEDTDGVITTCANTVLVARTGDCLPIIFTDEKNGVIGISHQGWRGSVKRMAQKMVKTMMVEGAQLPNIKIAIGPGIGECCYEIDDDMYYSFFEEFNGYSKKIFSRKQLKWHLNLLLLNYLQCLDIGVPKKNVDFFPFCTKCDKNRFYSFRRQKPHEFGEMFSYVVKH